MAAAIPFIISAVGTAASIASSQQAAQAQESAAKYNASVGRANAVQAEQQAQGQAQILGRKQNKQMGDMIAAYAANGISTSEGSPLDVISQSAADAELDKQTVLYNGQVRSVAFRNGATLSDQQGINARVAGDNAAAAALIKGAGQAYGMSSGAGSAMTAGGSSYGGSTAGVSLSGNYA